MSIQWHTRIVVNAIPNWLSSHQHKCTSTPLPAHLNHSHSYFWRKSNAIDRYFSYFVNSYVKISCFGFWHFINFNINWWLNACQRDQFLNFWAPINRFVEINVLNDKFSLERFWQNLHDVNTSAQIEVNTFFIKAIRDLLIYCLQS